MILEAAEGTIANAYADAYVGLRHSSCNPKRSNYRSPGAPVPRDDHAEKGHW